MNDPAIAMFEATRRARTDDALTTATTMLLDLFGEAYGPLVGEYSQADQLKEYAIRSPEACALLHGIGWSKLLNLPDADPQALQQWQRIQAGRTSPRRRAKSRK